jgi:hypothetical protein
LYSVRALLAYPAPAPRTDLNAAAFTQKLKTVSQSQSHIANDGRSVSQSVSKSWCRAPSGTHNQIISYYYLTVTVLFLWGALSDERTGLSFVYTAGS